MLISMLIQNHSPKSGNNSSSDAFSSEKPVEKEYQRKFVPTMSSLLTGANERKQLSDNIATYMRSAEAQTEIKGIPEENSRSDNSNSDSRTQGGFCFYSITRESEDIFVREDENGIRTHYCPLDRDWNSEVFQEANFLDDPMNVDQPTLMVKSPSESDNNDCEVTDISASTSSIYAPLENQPSAMGKDSSQECIIQKDNWMQYSSGHSSDDIPFLMAEMPSESDNEDENTRHNEVTDIDASTFMIYAPLQNEPPSIGEDSSVVCILQKGKKSPSFSYRLLDQKTMDAWAVDFSDGSDFDIYANEDLESIGKCTIGDESDMEEFNETPEVEKEKTKSIGNDKDIERDLEQEESPKSRAHGENDEHSEKKEDSDKCLDEGEQRNSKAKTESIGNDKDIERDLEQKESPKSRAHGGNDEHSEKKEDSDKCLDEGEQRTVIKPPDSNEKESKEDGESDSGGVQSSQTSEDQRERESLEAEVENAIQKATVKLNGLREIQKNPWTISSDIIEEIVIDDDFCRRFTSAHDFNKMNTVILEGENTNSDVERCGCKSKVSDAESSSKVEDGAIGFSPKAEPDTKDNEPKRPNEQKQGLLSMEPVAMNLERAPKSEETQPDLATQMRFMSEFYHVKEDELYPVSLSMDMPDEVPLTEMSKRSVISEEGENPNLNVKSQCKSSSSETAAATEEPKAEIRPQNKLTKLFKSFKKKFTKKA